MAVTQDPNASAEDVNKIIMEDQALTAKILKLVNSAFFGLPRQIGNVTDAVVILGFGTIRNLTLTASIFHTFGRKGKGNFDREALWQHSLGVGVISRLLGRKLKKERLEDLFVSGLLHDLGKVILDQHFHEDFVEAVRLAEERNCALHQTETEVFGVCHADIGSWLAERWNMPEFLTRAIAFHHHPGQDDSPYDSAAIVHVANSVARYRDIGYGGDPTKPPIQTDALQQLQLNKEHLNAVLHKLDEELDRANELTAIM